MDLSEISSLGETEAFCTSCGGFLLSKVCVSTILSNKSFNVTLLSLAGSSILMSSSISMNDFFIGVSDFEFMIDGDESIEALRDIRSSNLSPINRLSGLLLAVFGFFSLDNNKLLKNAFDEDFVFGDGVIGIGLDVEGLFLFSINSPSVRFFRFCLTISGSFLAFE